MLKQVICGTLHVTAINRDTLSFSLFSVYLIKLYPLKELLIVDGGRVGWLCVVIIGMWKGQVVSVVHKDAFVGKPDLKTVAYRGGVWGVQTTPPKF